MLSLFKPKKQSLVGIDIGTSAVKLLELERTSSRGGAYKILHFSHMPIPTGAMDGKRITDQLVVADVVRKAIVQSGTSTRHVASAVSAGTVMHRKMLVPTGLNDAEMLALVELEVSQHIPYPVDEVRYDFEVIGPSADNSDFVDVLLVASRGDVVDDLTTTLELAELIPSIIDVDSYALNLALTNSGFEANGQALGVVDIGSANMDLHVMRDHKVLYSREYTYGCEILTKDLMAASQQSYDQVNKMIKSGEITEPQQQMLFDGFVTGLVQEIRGAVQIYRSTTNSEKITQVYLAGGCARLARLRQALEEALEMKVTVLEPFDQMQYDKRIHTQRLFDNAPSMAVAFGLALRRFD